MLFKIQHSQQIIIMFTLFNKIEEKPTATTIAKI